MLTAKFTVYDKERSQSWNILREELLKYKKINCIHLAIELCIRSCACINFWPKFYVTKQISSVECTLTGNALPFSASDHIS